MLLEYMQQSQPYITLYQAAIFFSWGDKMLCNFESLIMILLSAYLAYLSTPSSGGLTMLLYTSLTYIRNNNLGTNCVST